jgi:hypothetical protein
MGKPSKPRTKVALLRSNAAHSQPPALPAVAGLDVGPGPTLPRGRGLRWPALSLPEISGRRKFWEELFRCPTMTQERPVDSFWGGGAVLPGAPGRWTRQRFPRERLKVARGWLVGDVGLEEGPAELAEVFENKIDGDVVGRLGHAKKDSDTGRPGARRRRHRDAGERSAIDCTRTASAGAPHPLEKAGKFAGCGGSEGLISVILGMVPRRLPAIG